MKNLMIKIENYKAMNFWKSRKMSLLEMLQILLFGKLVY